MRNRYGAILAVLLVPTLVWAAEPAIQGPESIQEGKLIRLSVSDLPPNATVEWEADTLDYDGTDDGKLIGAGLPAKHKVTARILTIEGQKVRSKRLSKYVTIDSIKPPTPVPPQPVPPQPNPVPVTADAWFIVIEDMNKRADYPELLSVFGKSFWETQPVDNRWRVFDYRNEDAKAHNLIQATKSPPYIVAMTPNGRILETKNITETTSLANIRTWVGKITGKTQISKNLAEVSLPCPTGVCPR